MTLSCDPAGRKPVGAKVALSWWHHLWPCHLGDFRAVVRWLLSDTGSLPL